MADRMRDPWLFRQARRTWACLAEGGWRLVTCRVLVVLALLGTGGLLFVAAGLVPIAASDGLHDPAVAPAPGERAQARFQVRRVEPGQPRDRARAAPHAVRAVAALAVRLNRRDRRALDGGARLRAGSVAMRESPELRRRQIRQRAQECHHRPDLVVAVPCGPGRHGGVLDAVLDDPEQFRVAQRAGAVRQVGRLGRHVTHHQLARDARRAMAGHAVGRIVPGALEHQRRVVERRRLHAEGAGVHGTAHRELQ